MCLIGSVVLNDVSGSRINKINRVMHEFLYNFEERNRKEEIVITQLDGRMFNLENTFNKVRYLSFFILIILRL